MDGRETGRTKNQTRDLTVSLHRGGVNTPMQTFNSGKTEKKTGSGPSKRELSRLSALSVHVHIHLLFSQVG